MRRMWMLLLVVTLMVIVLAVPAMAAEIVQENGEWPTFTGCPCGMVRIVDGAEVGGPHIDGCTKEEVEWSPWETTNALPATGNIYLTDNVKTSGQVKLTAGTSTAQNYLRINLNGKTISTSANRGFWLQNYSTLVITDTADGGSLVNTAKHDQGGIAWFNGSNAKFYLYAGTMDASGFANQQASSAGGAAICVNTTGGFYMYGGTLIASRLQDDENTGVTVGTAISYRVGTWYPNSKLTKHLAFQGAAITSSGTVVIEGGTIYGGDVQAGYHISRGLDLDNDKKTESTLTLDEATVGYDLNGDGDMEDTVTNVKESEVCNKITFMEGQGGAIYVSGGTFTMNGGTIYGGTAFDGSASYINADGETVTKSANGRGGAIYVNAGTVNLNGGTISGGTAYEGGCIYVKAGTVNITGTTIQNGTTTYYGGNICQAGGTVNMTGGTIKDGDATGGDYYAGNVSVKGGTFNMKKDTETGSTGTISGGEAKKNGGSVNITGGTFKMEAGTITGGKSSDQGGNIWNSATMIITGGTISGGEANRGGNIGVSSSKASSITGATITGGTAKTEGGNIAVNSTNSVGTLTIGAGTTITGGIAPKNGRNVYISNNTAGGSTSWATTVIIEGGAQITKGDSTSTGYDVWVQTGSKDGVEQTVNFNIAGSDAGTVIGDLYMEDTVTFTCDGYAVNYYEVVYDDLATAVNDVTADDGDYITLAADYEGTLAVTENLNLDLNGYTVALDPASDVKIKLFDSSAADYTVGTGKATGGSASNYVQVFLTGSMTNYGHNYRFVTIQEEDGFTAHRIYLAVKSTDLIPGAAPTVKHSIVLRCDSTLASLLNNSGSTYGLAVNGNSFDAISLANYAVEAYDAEEGVENAVRYGVTNILGTEGNQTFGETTMSANAFMSFTDAKGNAYSITSASSTARSLKDMVGLVNTAAADTDQVAAMSDALQAKLGEMYTTWGATMTEWGWSVEKLAQFVTTAE